jgi:hypothetical protein
VDKAKNREINTNESSKSRPPLMQGMPRHHSSSSSSKSVHSQLVDLVIEDAAAEEVERVRARKEGGPGWNEVEQKRFVYVLNRLFTGLRHY